MVNAMFAVLIAGSIGYVLSGWVGVAVGATVASAVAVLADALTPPIERGTSHERRMRRDRRYRARYEALEDGWRRPYPRSRKAWQPAIQPAREKPAVADPAPIDPMPAAVDKPELAPPLPDDSTQGQLPAGSKRPGRSPRAEKSSRTSAAPASTVKSDSAPARRSKGGRPSALAKRRLGSGAELDPSSPRVVRSRPIPP
jgi:hypothetical protein